MQQPANITGQAFLSKSQSLGTALKPFFNSENLSDVLFIIQTQRFHAHKLILAARSPYFNNLIFVNCRHSNTLEIEIQDANPNIFYQVLEFMYTDATILRHETVWDVFQAAKFYQLPDLTLLCEEFVVSTLNETTWLEYWKKAQTFEASNAAEHCSLYVKSRFASELQRANVAINQIDCNSNPEQLALAIRQQQLMMPPKQVAPSSSVVVKFQQPASSSTSTTQPKQEDEMYHTLLNYSFPVKKMKKAPAGDTMDEDSHQAEETSPNKMGADDSGAASNSDLILQPQQHSSIQQQQQHYTQAFELFAGSNTIPPAFPTPESIAAFPQFFRLDDFLAPSPATPASNGNNQAQLAHLQSAIASSARANSIINARKKSIVHRRLSVISDPSSVAIFFQHMISAITKLLEAERTTLFIYDKESDELCSQVAIGECEIRIPSDKGIAGSVFKSGKSVNVADAYSSNQFASEVDKSTGFVTRHVLCSPIVGSEGRVVGVLEVMNKQTGTFTDLDEKHMFTAAALLSKFIQENLDDEKDVPKALSEKVHLLNPNSYATAAAAAKKEDGFIIDEGDWSEILGSDFDINNQQQQQASSSSASAAASIPMVQAMQNLQPQVVQPQQQQQQATAQFSNAAAASAQVSQQQQQQQFSLHQFANQVTSNLVSRLQTPTEVTLSSLMHQISAIESPSPQQQVIQVQQPAQQAFGQWNIASPHARPQKSPFSNNVPTPSGIAPSQQTFQQMLTQSPTIQGNNAIQTPPQQQQAQQQYAQMQQRSVQQQQQQQQQPFMFVNDGSQQQQQQIRQQQQVMVQQNNGGANQSDDEDEDDDAASTASGSGRRRKPAANKKRKREQVPFMHFRIPRYELQFIQFDAAGMKKK